jgi:hypothetical protein
VQISGDAVSLLEDGKALSASLELIDQSRVVDRDPSLRCQRDGDAFVIFGEVLGPLLLGQIEAPEYVITDDDRNPEERAHRRMISGKAIRSRVVRDLPQSEGCSLFDQCTEHPPADGKVSDHVRQRPIDARVDEARQLSMLPQHSDSAVASADDFSGYVRDALQQAIQIQLRGEGHPRLHE